MEPIKRRFEIFLNACRLCAVCTESKDVMFPLLETTFLKEPLLLYSVEHVSTNAYDFGEAVRMLEAQVLDDRAKRVNDNIWIGLSFELAKSVRTSRNHIEHSKWC